MPLSRQHGVATAREIQTVAPKYSHKVEFNSFKMY